MPADGLTFYNDVLSDLQFKIFDSEDVAYFTRGIDSYKCFRKYAGAPSKTWLEHDSSAEGCLPATKEPYDDLDYENEDGTTAYDRRIYLYSDELHIWPDYECVSSILDKNTSYSLYYGESDLRGGAVGHYALIYTSPESFDATAEILCQNND